LAHRPLTVDYLFNKTKTINNYDSFIIALRLRTRFAGGVKQDFFSDAQRGRARNPIFSIGPKY
jgi:hypothetical protein